MGILGLLGLTVIGILVVGSATAGIAYASDYGLEATIVEKKCNPPAGGSLFGGKDPGSSWVAIKTLHFGLDHTEEGLSYSQCLAVEEGNYLVYRVKSGRLSVYESPGGSCIYDSVGGAAGCP